MNDAERLGKLVVCPTERPGSGPRIGIIIDSLDGPGCVQYLVRTPDGALLGPYQNFELTDAETNSQIK